MNMLLEKIGQLVVVRCWCGVQHAVPKTLHNLQMRQFNDGRRVQTIYCPLGHEHQPTGETKVARLQNQLGQEQARTHRERAAHDQTRTELRNTELRRRAEKAAKTRLKNRMDAKHPGYTEAPSP